MSPQVAVLSPRSFLEQESVTVSTVDWKMPQRRRKLTGYRLGCRNQMECRAVGVSGHPTLSRGVYSVYSLLSTYRIRRVVRGEGQGDGVRRGSSKAAVFRHVLRPLSKRSQEHSVAFLAATMEAAVRLYTNRH